MSLLATIAKGQAAATIFADPELWQDQAAPPIPLSNWLGHGLLVVTMAYTNCQRTCPMTVKLMRDIEAKLRREHREAAFLILSLDPKHDTPEKVADFLQSAATPGSHWHFLRGRQAATDRLAAALGIEARPMDEHIIHRFKVWVFDAQGATLQVFDWNHRDVSSL